MPHPKLPADLHSPGPIALAILTIILIDIVLAGDNAVVIAMAVRTLPDKQRKWGIFLGAGLAVVLRVALTAFAAYLMELNYIKLVGGIFILGIAVKLLLQEQPHEEGGNGASTLWQAVWMIMVADLTMSIDNVLAVAGASKGNSALLIFGLGLSIPLVVFASNLLANWMNRFPIIVTIGAAILGKVAGDLIMDDHFTQNFLHPTEWMETCVEMGLAGGVILLAHTLKKRRKRGEF
jgi:YjbE family integral membrane protein